MTFLMKNYSAVALVCSLMVGGCTTPLPVAPAPQTISVPMEIHFDWFPPGGGLRYEISISEGDYKRAFETHDQVYYVAEHGLVAKTRRGDSVKKVEGGIGYSEKRGEYFVWKTAPSFTSIMPLNGLLDTFEDGPPVQIYLALVPEKMERNLTIGR